MPIPPRRAGVVSILAMMFLVIFSALAAAMAIVAQGNLQTAETYQRVNRSLATAETGMKFAEYHTARIAQQIHITEGEVDASLADGIWDRFRDMLIDEAGGWMHFAAGEAAYTVEESGERIILGRIPVGGESGAPTFQIILERHPLVGEDYGDAFYNRDPYNIGADDPNDENPFTRYSGYPGEPVSSVNPIDRTWVRIRSVGRDGEYARSVQMDFRIDKKVRFAVLSRNRIMIGRNVMIHGDIGSRYTQTEYTHGHPVQMRDNFHGLDAELDDWLDALEDYLAGNDRDHDNRVRLDDGREGDNLESSNLANAADYDRNGDGYVDAYDMFLLRYDGADYGGNEDGALSMSEFSDSGGVLLDGQLWRLINEMKYPPGTEFDWPGQRVKRPEDADWIDASGDMSVIDEEDRYAKIAGQIILEATKESWESGAAEGPYQKYLEDSIIPEPDDNPLIFEAGNDRLADFTPGDFDTSTYRNKASNSFDEQVANAVQNDTSQPVESGVAPLESVPYNSPHPYDYYERPVYKNYTFKNVRIPSGTNALFEDCRFIGVTYLETESGNTDQNYNYAGTLNSDGSLKYPHVTAVVNGVEVSDTKPYSNNIRFDNCTFEGMIASGSKMGDAPQEFTHVRNKVQFTGRTRFDLEADSLTKTEKEMFRKSTLLAPHYSVDMGTFINPTGSDETVQLDGTIVTGVFDIRGQAVIDGSIITTFEPVSDEGPLAEGGNPANFNTTIGYFESAAGDGEGEMPEGGYGKILLRYDPTRALPDGITAAIEVRPDRRTYHEGG